MNISDYDRKKKVIAKFWEKNGTKGPYMSGYLQDLETGERTNVMCWQNKKRPGKKDPDWLFCLSDPEKERKRDENDFGGNGSDDC